MPIYLSVSSDYYICNGVEVRLTPTTPSGPKDHNIQRMLNMPNTVHIQPTHVPIT
ncbi:uncharacterized protein RAG0_16739 [Rhynchosporium agropyri]|uniref:Uncharacterized protein n=1 Tax=Rhynchosporium agropyri TaxID=914238 RepID=A0A1E1LRQ2_9HELO|nr:uncharacterized protein RAG0_16739 [Rhynchosporium agropyri]